MKGMKKRILAMLLLGAMAVQCLGGCSANTDVPESTETENVNVDSELDDNGFFTTSGDLPIDDMAGWYDNWDSNDVVTMYLTVREGNSDDGTDHTWEEVNTHSAYFYEEMGIDRYKVEGLLQIGDEYGPTIGELGYGQYTPNAVVQIRGQSSSLGEQKNYRISLRDGKGDWEGMTTINLNKHSSDMFRFTNMLSYNLMQEVDGMMSSRTRFVHLYVKDETSSGTTGGFEDYGLYTFVEQFNKSYLTNHGLDKNGQLYKINFFEFYRYEDVIMLRSDADYDVTEFEQYLEIKGNDDHSKLIAMLDDLNDYGKPIEEVMEKWFDEENYFSWLAFHIVMGNKDTQSRNHFLYSPSNVNKFYFISWDNDASLKSALIDIRNSNAESGFDEGISNYWGNVLHKRVLQSPEYRAKLDAKIKELMEEVITEENVTTMANAYAKTVRPYLFSLPDITYSRVSAAQYDYAVNNIYSYVEQNYERYLNNLEEPMPFFLGDPFVDEDQEGKIKFHWDSSYDFDQETITYKFELSRGYTFSNMVYEKDDLIVPEVYVDALPPGQYFYRVTATNESGYSQMAFDTYAADSGNIYGIKCFWVTEDGQIQVDVYEEE